MAILETSKKQRTRVLLARVYDKHHHAMFAVASKIMTEAPCNVEDVLQSAFIRIVPHLEQIDQMSDDGARAYMLKTVKTEALKFLKKEQVSLKYSVPLDEQYENSIPDDTDILDELCKQEQEDEMVRILREMPAVYRDVLELYYVSHMNLREIAEHFHLRYDTVRKRFQRGKDLLAKRITKKGGLRYEKRTAY